jgi:hypothetical protein
VDKEKPDFPVGYRKPPHETRFKPGQSGNPSGRPKKKITTFAETIERELHTFITANEGGKSIKITKLDAIAKQQTNKAVSGDPKATALVMKAVEPRQFDPIENLSPVLYEMRAIHARHEIANQNGTTKTGTSHLSDKVENDDEDRQ